MDIKIFLICVQVGDAELKDLVKKNSGELDMLLLMFLGACGDHLVRSRLSVFYPGLEAQHLKDKAERVLRAKWSSPRTQAHEGEMFALQALYESQRGDLAISFRPRKMDANGVWDLTAFDNTFQNVSTVKIT